MPSLPYYVFDVFTDTPLTGNPLAVVDLREQSLNDDLMQLLAKEFNLSETVYLQAPENPVHTAKLRIFTPDRELPFAGHPTVGAAIALARNGIADGLSTGLVLMEEKIGPIRAAVKIEGEKALRTGGFAEFDLIDLPEETSWSPEKDDVALALGLGPHQIGFENHMPTDFDGGLPYFCIPVADMHALNSVQAKASLFSEVFAGGRGHDNCYIYTRETVGANSHFACRMLWNINGAVREDPATGSAASSLIGAIVKFDAPTEGMHRMTLEQGFAMGRPSHIGLELEINATGSLVAARMGGDAVCVAEGTLHI